jgi:hypothetical protein
MADYKDYTDEEYDALDEYYTTHLPKTVTGKPGAFTRWQQQKMKQEASAPSEACQGQLTVTLTMDASLISRLASMAEQAHETPSEIITEMIRHEMAYA